MKPRFFAIVPAAGRSVRMGQPKLLLPCGRQTVIERVLSAWRASLVNATIVVVHPEDESLAELCRSAGAEVVVADPPPPDMKASVSRGLQYIAATFQPTDCDAWLVAPADMPRLSAAVINRLLAQFRPLEPAVLVASHQERRGHPVLLPWSAAAAVGRLRHDEGMNALLDHFAWRQVECDDDSIFADLDTPHDYKSLSEHWRRDESS